MTAKREKVNDRKILTPNPDHPISIAPNPKRVVVRAGDVVIADTRNALELREASYPPVQYIPSSDVDMVQLTKSNHATYCPYKGDAGYFSIDLLGEAGVNAVWIYEAPYPAVADISEHVAFYPDKVSISIEP